MASVNAAKLAMPSAEKNNPSAVPELKLQMEAGANEARRNFRTALTLVDDDTPLEQLNEVIVRQQQQIDLLINEIRQLRQQLPAQAGSAEFRSLRDELPPHY